MTERASTLGILSLMSEVTFRTTSREARSNRRFTISEVYPLYCTSIYGSTKTTLKVIDVSLGGAAVEDANGSANFAHDSVHSIRFETPSGLVTIPSHTRLRDDALRRRSIGVEFECLSYSNRRLLGELLQTRTSASADELQSEGFVVRAKDNSDATGRDEASDSVQWDRYAEAYDIMCAANPAYKSNLQIFSGWMKRIELPSRPVVCDLGAGTGNYLIAAHAARRDGSFIHVDRDPAMNLRARRKYQKAEMHDICFQAANADEYDRSEASVDVLVCVNALYTFKNPLAVISRARRWLKPGGRLFSIDLGRRMDVASWSKYIIASNVQSRGILETLVAFYDGRHAISQNRLIRHQQDNGRYWMHSTQEFEDLFRTAGYEVTSIGVCYRGYCDVITATTPAR